MRSRHDSLQAYCGFRRVRRVRGVRRFRRSFLGFVGFLGGDASGLVNGNNKAWSLTPSLSWAAFDFGTVRARLRASKAEAEGVAAQYEQTVLLALEDTENALTRYSKQQARLAIVEGRYEEPAPAPVDPVQPPGAPALPAPVPG